MVTYKKIFERKLPIKEARKQQNDIEKQIAQLHNRIDPGKGMKTSTKKTLEDLYSDAKNLYIIRENIINKNLILQQVVMMIEENQ